MYAVPLQNKIKSTREHYMHVYTTLVWFAWSTWCMDIRGVIWLSIKPGYVKMKIMQILCKFVFARYNLIV